jgi:hypothetical protein
MNTYEINENGLLISDNRAQLDRAFIFDFLRNRSYWAQEITPEILARSI